MDNTSQWLLAGGDILEVKFQRQIKNFTSDFFFRQYGSCRQINNALIWQKGSLSIDICKMSIKL